MSVLAAVRPDSWNLPLFVHVLGAMILVGGLLTGASALGFAQRRGEVSPPRILVAPGRRLPGWVLMRVGAEWIYSKEGWDDLPDGVDDPGWLGVGSIIADAGGLILLVSLIVGGVGVYRLREGKGVGLLRLTLVLSSSSWRRTSSPSGRWPANRTRGLMWVRSTSGWGSARGADPPRRTPNPHQASDMEQRVKRPGSC